MDEATGSSPPAEYVPDLSLWLGRPGVQDYPAGEEFGRLTAALRLLQDRVAGARPPGSVAAVAAERLEELAALLGEFSVGEPEQVASRLMSEPGRAQTLIPALRVDSWDGERVRGTMKFHRFHLGSNGAAHGGAISLFFDDLLGQLANAPGHPRARTAWIRVNYRRIIPIEFELVATAQVSHRHGRKLTVTGELRDGDVVVADAEGLFIQLRSDQP